MRCGRRRMNESIIIEPLGNVFKTTSGGTPSRKKSEFYHGDIPWVKSGELENNIIFDTEEKITEDAIKNSSAKIFPAGTILIALYGATIGKLAFLGIRATTNQAICGIFDNGVILSKYTYYFLLFSRPKLVQSGIGGAQPNISQDIVRKQPFPIIPLPEQRAVVYKIEQLFSDLDNGIENFKKAQEQLKIYRQAVLKKAIEGEFTKKWREEQTDMSSAEELLKQVKDEREKHYEKQLDEWKSTVKDWEDDGKEGKKPTKPKKPIKSESLSNEELETLNQIPNGWTVSRFIDLIKYEKNAIKRGPFGSAIKKSFFVSSGYKVYEQQNAIKNDGSLGNYYINEKKFKELNGFSVKGGDYIVSCSGTIGRIHKLQMNCENGVINQALLKIALDEHLMLSQYFLYLFRSEVFQRKILKGTRGTGMQNLASVNEIKSIPINIPPKTEQSQIVQEIETRLSICDNMETTMTESLQKAESLRQSILKRAFEGKLLNEKELEEVRNAPDWEPAEKLLERIRAEKTNVSKGRLI